MTTYTTRIYGTTSQPSPQSFVKLDISESVQLNWPSNGLNAGVATAAYWTEINALQPNLTVSLPNAMQQGLGQSITVVNIGANPFDLLDYSGNLLLTFQVGTSLEYYIANNTTPAGNWNVYIPKAPDEGEGTVQSVAARANGAGLDITGDNPITTTGEFQFELDTKLQQLVQVDSNGFLINKGDDLDTRVIGSGSNILIQNGNGVAGNPIISLSRNLTQLTSVTATTGNFTNLNLTNISFPGKMVALASIGFPVAITQPTLLKGFNVSSVNFVSQSGTAPNINVIVKINFITPLINPFCSPNIFNYSNVYGTNNTFATFNSIPAIGRTYNVVYYSF